MGAGRRGSAEACLEEPVCRVGPLTSQWRATAAAAAAVTPNSLQTHLQSASRALSRRSKTQLIKSKCEFKRGSELPHYITFLSFSL